jgi:uncharacterized protein (DUF362 family)
MSMVKSHPRRPNPYTDEGKPIVAKVPVLNGDFLNERVQTAFQLLGGLEESIRPGDAVMIKPNFNCAYRAPLSTDIGILKSLIEILLDFGARVCVGESSGRGAGPTAGVVEQLSLARHLQWYGVTFVNFDEDEWIEMEIPGRYWSSITVPRSIYEAQRRVYLANARCHSSARFTASMKLSVGWLASAGRDDLHGDKDTTEAKVPELNLGWYPDVVLMDLRRTTVSWHGRGDYVYPNVIMASGDMVAIDTEAVKILKTYPADNRINLPLDQLGQFVAATRLDLGSMEYELRAADALTGTEEQGITDPAAIEIMMERNRPRVSRSG